MRSTSSAGALLLLTAALAWAQHIDPTNPAPDRRPGEGEGPFDRLVIRGVTVIDGTGAQPRGPMDIVVEKNRIAEVRSVGVPHVPIDEKGRPPKGTKELDAAGMYLMPGFVDLHTHTGGAPKAPDAEYVYKLWMAHGVTTVRGVPSGTMDWTLHERERSAKNEIVAPRMYSYFVPFTGEGWKSPAVITPDTAREWVRWAKQKGIDGVKLFGDDPEIEAAVLSEANSLGLGSTAHLSQTYVARFNARDAVAAGLGTVTHYYGLFEALLRDRTLQQFPADQNYNDEQMRFGEQARLWNQIHPRGSKQWNDLLEFFLAHHTVLDPTMSAYVALRDRMRAGTAEWLEKYALPSMWAYSTPNRTNHATWFYDWTSEDEYHWKNFFRVWMDLLKDYNDMGGRVTCSTDSFSIWSFYGFSYIEEMELLREAGLSPLEIIRSATLYPAQALVEPQHKPIEFGLIRPGLLADMVIVDQNPLANLKVLYGTGALRLNDQTGKVERIGGVKYTIKDGIIYDAKKLLADVAAMVQKQKQTNKGSDSIGPGSIK
ncbi:MAG TPA: amidohydrolase family protein [Bryobacteraceae bacterium]|nr:amidohydrolase family protein [Bryobacteraceae bacterium]